MEVELSESSPCRTCLSKEYTSSVNLDQVWASKIEYCLGFQVSSSSKNLCEKCVKILEEFYEFKEKCYKVNSYWLNYDAENEITETNLKTETLDEDKNTDDKIENFILFNKEIQYEHSQDSLISMKYESASDSYVHLDGDHEPLLVSEVETKAVKRKSKRKKSIQSAKRKYVCEGEKKIEQVVTDTLYKPNCKLCNLHFKHTKSYIYHCKTKHGMDMYSIPMEYHCGLCNYSTEDKNSRKIHLTEHFNNKELNCKLCDFTGSDLAEMEVHRFSHYPEKGINLICHACDSPHKNSFTLEYHYRSVHLKKKGGYCKLCDKEFKVYRTWRNHDRKHKGKNFICDICGFKFLFKNQIISHIMCHNKVKSKICDYCGLGFNSTHCLKVHIRGIHTKHSPVVCAHCNKTFKSQYTLDHHMKIVNADKPFECNVCFKKYESQNSLASHMIWHSDDRPFTCDICNSKFKCKSYLTVHKMRHAGHVKMKCSYCDKGFTAKRNLLIHESIHTGDRLYKCTHCTKSYNHKKSYLKHLATHGPSEMS